jgi:hypothetical protein
MFRAGTGRRPDLRRRGHARPGRPAALGLGQALELAELTSRESHERDDDGQLDRWEQGASSAWPTLGEVDRARSASRRRSMPTRWARWLRRLRRRPHGLAAGLAHRALHLNPDEPHALAVMARVAELHGSSASAPPPGSSSAR